MAPLQDTILKNASIVQSHMKQHQAAWGEPLQLEPLTAPVLVFVRVRPLLERDVEMGAYSLVMTQMPRTIHFTHPTNRWAGGRFATKTFDADGAFADDASNDEVYTGMGIESSLNACLLGGGHDLYVVAYGQTGTGKTYTTTYLEERLSNELSSCLPKTDVPTLYLSIFEVRGERAYDLLSNPPLATVKIQGSPGDITMYPGLSRHLIQKPADMLRLIAVARELRLTRSTVKNDTSSRSHCIANIHFQHSGSGTHSNIYIVDLAGSERSAYATMNDSERIKESIETNKSLAALKDCIRARLTPNTTHIPWRGSKLTMVLRRAFELSTDAGQGRTCRLAIIACVSPSVIDCDDTANTLKYIMPFQLTGRDMLDAAVHSTNNGLLVNDWNHDESVAYIKRYMSKLTPVVDRLLPTPSSTLASLFPLSLPELTARACGSAPPGGPTSTVDPQTLANIRKWMPAQHRKLLDLARRSEEGRSHTEQAMKRQGAPRAGGTSRAALMRTLNGVNPESNETGFITRVDAAGNIVQLEAGQGPDRMRP